MGTTFPDQGRAATPPSALLSLPPHFEFQGHSCRPLRPTGQDTAVKGRYLHPPSSPSFSHAFQGRSFKAHWSRQGGQGSISLLTREPISRGGPSKQARWGPVVKTHRSRVDPPLHPPWLLDDFWCFSMLPAASRCDASRCNKRQNRLIRLNVAFSRCRRCPFSGRPGSQLAFGRNSQYSTTTPLWIHFYV